MPKAAKETQTLNGPPEPPESHLLAVPGLPQLTMPMLSPGQAKQARMWVYVGDETQPYNVFDFTLSRGRDGPVRFLKDYNQVLLADAEKVAPEMAREAVEWIGRLYAVEKQAKDVSVAERLQLRQLQSLPILVQMRSRFLTWKEQLLPKHPMAEAVNYTLGQWQELNVFCSDGAVPIDNNVSEREMKRVVLNRKNSLFVGNERGGRTAASLASTCRRHDIDPQLYFTQLLMNLPQTKMSQLAEWLPDQWKLRHAERLANLPTTTRPTP